MLDDRASISPATLRPCPRTLMRKLLLIPALLTVCCWPASAQTYQVDNFDFASAIRIQTPPEPVKKTPPTTKKLTKIRNHTYPPPAGPLVEHTTKPTNP